MSEFEDHEGNGTVADAIYDEENGGRDGEIEDQLDSKPKVISPLIIFNLLAYSWSFESIFPSNWIELRIEL
jgi:hypothetical protein